MKIADLCTRDVATIERSASLRDAACLMRSRHVGALVVVEGARSVGARPAGMITDRDIVVAVVAVAGARPEAIRVGDAMSAPAVTVREGEGLYEVLNGMAEAGVRRLPVVGEDGLLVGIVSTDDVLRAIAAGLGRLARGVQTAARHEREQRVSMEGS